MPAQSIDFQPQPDTVTQYTHNPYGFNCLAGAEELLLETFEMPTTAKTTIKRVMPAMPHDKAIYRFDFIEHPFLDEADGRPRTNLFLGQLPFRISPDAVNHLVRVIGGAGRVYNIGLIYQTGRNGQPEHKGCAWVEVPADEAEAITTNLHHRLFMSDSATLSGPLDVLEQMQHDDETSARKPRLLSCSRAKIGGPRNETGRAGAILVKKRSPRA